MKKIIKWLTIPLLLAGAFHSQAQYIPAAAPETIYSPLTPMPPPNGKYNVGTDTRAGYSIYPNYFNVTVSDYDIGGSRFMFWENSGVGVSSGSLMLPASDAVDPDIVLVEYAGTPNPAKALVVYYSPATNLYYLTISDFTLGGFVFWSLIMPIDNLVGGKPYINIDSDNNGNFAIVYQYSDVEIRSVYAHISAVGLLPSTIEPYSGLIEPDVAVSTDGVTPIAKITALRLGRNDYVVLDRDLTSGISTPPLLYPGLGFTLERPRIACPYQGPPDQYAITIMGNYTYILLDISPFSMGMPTILNDGGYGGLTNISAYKNMFPAVTYNNPSGGPISELVSVGWYADYLPGAPTQPATMVGLDIVPNMFPMPPSLTTPGFYQDVSQPISMDYSSEIALSGRYTRWAKTAAFATVTSNYLPNRLVWKYINSGVTSWRPTDISTLKGTDAISVYPNITTDVLNIKSGLNNNERYDYQIYTTTGQVMQTGVIQAQKGSINVSNLPSGSYYIGFKNAHENITPRPFVKL